MTLSTVLGQRLDRRVRNKAVLAGNRAAVALEVQLRRNFQPHRKSGDTQAATSVRPESQTGTTLTWVAKADTPQARYVNDGTRAHPIAARGNAAAGSKWPTFQRGERLLVFDWARAGMFPARFRWVSHPGYRGSGWWDFTIATWPDLVQSAYSQTTVPD